MKGECLCGEVAFEIEGHLGNLYQCHCSLCRKATGAAANAATFVPSARFRWLSGQQTISSFQKSTGYRSDFCTACGSPVPNPLRGKELMWVPAGLLEESFEASVTVHLHLQSAALWDHDGENCLRLDAGPESLETLEQALKRASY